MTAAGQPIWTAPISLLDRYRLWRRGTRLVSVGWPSYDDITPDLADHGVEVHPWQIDIAAFWRYVDEMKYRERTYWHGGRMRFATEKWLEHFVSIDLLRPKKDEVFIDIASCQSPFPDILRDTWGCKTYRQDWMYARGLHGDRIGGDAAAIPLPAEFADGLSLHCSFEHFERDRDIRFIREAERILRPGGRLCILPLYTSSTYSIETDLAMWSTLGSPDFDRDAVICLFDGWGERHGRFYDASHFIERIIGNLGSLRLDLYRIDNHKDVGPDCYLWFAAVFTKP